MKISIFIINTYEMNLSKTEKEYSTKTRSTSRMASDATACLRLLPIDQHVHDGIFNESVCCETSG